MKTRSPRRAREHGRQRAARDQHRAEQIRRELALEVRDRHLVQQARDADAGVADHHVDRRRARASVAAKNASMLSASVTSSACAKARPPAASTPRATSRQRLGAPRAERDRPAERAERARDRGADARRRAGHDRRPRARSCALRAVPGREADRQRREAAHVDRVHAHDARGRRSRSRGSGAAPPRARRGLEPRERRAETEVRALAEREHGAGVAQQVVAIGIGKHALVAIGRADQQHDAIAVAHALAVQLDVARDACAPAPASSRRSAASPRPSAGSASGSASHEAALLGIAPQPVDGVAEQLGRRLVAGDDHQEEEADDLDVVEAVAVDLGGEQRAREIVARLRACVGDQLVEVAEHVHRRLHAGRRHVGHALLAVHDRVGPGAQLVAIGLGHAEHLADHVHRQLAGEVADEVAAPGCDERDRCGWLRELADARLELGDAARREAARHQRAHARVARRVHGEERHRRVRARMRRRRVERDAVAVREARDVAKAGEHVGVARQRPEAEPLVAIDRRLGAQLGVDRVRILVDLVGVGIVLAHAVSRRRRA